MIEDMWFPSPYDKYDAEEEYPVKKSNRRNKVDKRQRAHEDFMKVNNIGVKKVILPLLEKKSREARAKREG